jgi:hypothetical protein
MSAINKPVTGQSQKSPLTFCQITKNTFTFSLSIKTDQKLKNLKNLLEVHQELQQVPSKPSTVTNFYGHH